MALCPAEKSVMCHLTLNAPRADARLCSDRWKRSVQTRFYVLSQHSLGVPTFPKDPAAKALLRRHAMSPRRDVTGRRAGERGGPGPEGRAGRERRPAARPGAPRFGVPPPPTPSSPCAYAKAVGVHPAAPLPPMVPPGAPDPAMAQYQDEGFTEGRSSTASVCPPTHRERPN